MNNVKKIYVNTLPVTIKSGGIKTFLLELLHAFGKTNNPALSYCIICSKDYEYIYTTFLKYNNFSIKTIKTNNENPIKRIFYEQFSMPKILNRQKNGILLNVCNIANFRCNLPQVTIIQAQMSIKKLRQSLPKEYNSIGILHKIYYDLFLEKSIRKSARTIAISNYMVQFLDKYKNKIEIIHEGVNVADFNPELKNMDNQERPYILSVSTLFPHKNMKKAIEAFSLFLKRTNLDYNLMIVGKDPDGKQLNKLKRIAKDCNVEDRIIFKGWVEDAEIPGLYANASLFLYLSSMEFFGLPVLEAMASNIPVIAANKMSIPEVVNDAGILVEPDDIELISKNIEHILNDYSYSNSLVELGKKNVKEFNWQFTAEKFEKVFLNLN